MFKIKPTAVKNYDLNFKLTDKPNSINFDIKTEVQGEAIKINNAQKSQFPRSQNHQDTPPNELFIPLIKSTRLMENVETSKKINS